MPDLTVVKRSPDDFDWGTIIVLNIILVILGAGMCCCLQRANRLIPNRFSFPLVDRRGPHHLGDEEDGLLSHYNDNYEQDAELFEDQERFESHARGQSRVEQNEQQQQLDENDQEVLRELQPIKTKKPAMFGLGDEEEEDEDEEEDADNGSSSR